MDHFQLVFILKDDSFHTNQAKDGQSQQLVDYVSNSYNKSAITNIDKKLELSGQHLPIRCPLSNWIECCIRQLSFWLHQHYDWNLCMISPRCPFAKDTYNKQTFLVFAKLQSKPWRSIVFHHQHISAPLGKSVNYLLLVDTNHSCYCVMQPSHIGNLIVIKMVETLHLVAISLHYHWNQLKDFDTNSTG